MTNPFRWLKSGTAIDERHGKGAAEQQDNTATPVKLWRVEPGTFAMERSVGDEDAKK